MTLQEMRRQLNALFTQHEIESPEADSGLLLMHTLSLTKTELLLDNRTLSPDEISHIMSLADRRILGESVRYLTGCAPFMDLEFTLNSETLIPRPDTEVLVEAVSERISGNPLTLWDIGCGSGCIGISLAYLHPNLNVVALDISQEALDAAKTTANRYGLQDSIDFRCHDILSGMPNLPAPDIIVSNPPYIPSKDIESLQKEVRFFEPRRALDGGEDGLLFYRFIAKHALLSTGGLLAFEIGYDQGESVPRILAEHGYRNIVLLKDLSGNPRVVLGNHS